MTFSRTSRGEEGEALLNDRADDGWPLHARVMRGEGASDEAGPPVLLMHGGGPDHRSLLPLAGELRARFGLSVILPDVRGYGRSVCREPALHTWARYADDVVSWLDCLGVQEAVVGGAGLGSTIALRVALAHPDRVAAAVLVSVEDIEDDQAKEAERRYMEAFAERVRRGGIQAGWAPILGELAPLIGRMVEEALPRADRESAAAAAAIGRDRSFRSLDELRSVHAPILVIPGMDRRHPPELAQAVAQTLPRGELARVAMSAELRDAEDFGLAFAPAIGAFVRRHFGR